MLNLSSTIVTLDSSRQLSSCFRGETDSWDSYSAIFPDILLYVMFVYILELPDGKPICLGRELHLCFCVQHLFCLSTRSEPWPDSLTCPLRPRQRPNQNCLVVLLTQILREWSSFSCPSCNRKAELPGKAMHIWGYYSSQFFLSPSFPPFSF